jgi:hypothetical protein
MSHWWRAHDEAVDDPKLCLLSDRAHRAWFNLCCLTSANGGTFPNVNVILLKLRLSKSKLASVFEELKEAGLIDEDETGVRPHNWNGRQFKSDISTERVKQHRERQRNVSVTPPETENRNREESKIAASAATTPGKAYEFEDGIIRLTAKDFIKWEKAFSYLDLRAELTTLVKWAGDEGPDNWFFAVSGALGKRNREVKRQLDLAKQGGPQLPLTRAGNPWPEGQM